MFLLTLAHLHIRINCLQKITDMKKLFVCIIVVLLCLTTPFVRVHKYNDCVKELNERYLCLYGDLQCIVSNETVTFETINGEYAFFLTTYAEWESLYRKNCEINLIPKLHREIDFAPEDAVKAYRNLRDFYYKCVQEVYFDKKVANEQLQSELETVNNDFSILFEKLSFFP